MVVLLFVLFIKICRNDSDLDLNYNSCGSETLNVPNQLMSTCTDPGDECPADGAGVAGHLLLQPLLHTGLVEPEHTTTNFNLSF